MKGKQSVSVPVQLEDVTRERDELIHERDELINERGDLTHEVQMLRETISHGAEQSAAARASRDSALKDVAPSNSIAGQFHAHNARLQELQNCIQASSSLFLFFQEPTFPFLRGCID
jgi:uncharacterized coiled-coil DUF342 family protein